MLASQSLLDKSLALDWLTWGLALTDEQVALLGLSDLQVRMLGTQASKVINNAGTGALTRVKTTTFICQQCGEPFVRQWRTKPYKYCCNACKQKAYRIRNGISK